LETALEHGADPRDEYFMIQDDKVPRFELSGQIIFYKSRADVDVRRSSLYYAVLNNAVDCVEALLQAGACPNNPQVLLHHNHNLNLNLVGK